MDINFSELNLEYFVTARDFANKNITSASVLLGTTLDFTQSIAALSSRQIARMSCVNVPVNHSQKR